MKGAKQRGSNRGLWVLLGGLGCIICVLVMVLVMVIKGRSAETGVRAGDSEQPALVDDWGEYIDSEDADGLIELTNRQIESADDDEIISDIYASRAGVLYNFDATNDSNKYGPQILSDIYNAEEYYPTEQTAYLIYVYEQVYGDPVVAEEYLNIAEERGRVVIIERGDDAEE